ncbi:rCG28048 [Rattus norvegicus]|uniref:RCG28048 n=1 Tax=Rattus norvegicus TaxID=10116 RepID=A6IE49_RAT|nr:rCG28048 [Rattus norvegicus]
MGNNTEARRHLNALWLGEKKSNDNFVIFKYCSS